MVSLVAPEDTCGKAHEVVDTLRVIVAHLDFHELLPNSGTDDNAHLAFALAGTIDVTDLLSVGNACYKQQ